MNQNEAQEAADREPSLEQALWNLSEYQRDEDFYSLYGLLRGRQVYMPVDASSLSAGREPGEKYTTDALDELRARLVAVGDSNEPFIPAATCSTNSMLEDAYVEIEWMEFLRMAAKMPDVEGVMLQGESSWVALDKDRISYVLDWYENIQDPGPGLPMLPILALLIAGCIYFFGWIVIGAVAAIALVISVGTMIYDASH